MQLENDVCQSCTRRQRVRENPLLAGVSNFTPREPTRPREFRSSVVTLRHDLGSSSGFLEPTAEAFLIRLDLSFVEFEQGLTE